MSLPGTGHEVEEKGKVTPVKSSRPKRHLSSSGTIDTVNLDAIPQAVARLDNSAAKHKLSVKPKNQRVSRKHRRLTKVLDCLGLASGKMGSDKPIQNREGQKQFELAVEKRKQDHLWKIPEAEKKRRMAAEDEKRRLAGQRHEEAEDMKREQKRRRYEEEKLLTTEEQKHQEEGEINQEEQSHQELEEQTRQEEQSRQELEEQKLQEDQRCQELEEQKRQEEWKHHEQEEQRRRELEEQKRQEERKCQELEDQKRQEEQRRQELEEQRRQEEQRQERKRQELEEQRRQELEECQELEEQKMQEERKHQELEEQKRQELEEQRCHEIKKQHDEEHKKEQRCQELEKKRHLEAKEKLLQEEEAKRLEAHKRIEEQKQHQEEEKYREEEQKQQELKKQEYQKGEELEIQEKTELKVQLFLENPEEKRKSPGLQQDNDDVHFQDGSQEPAEKQLLLQKTAKQPEKMKNQVEEKLTHKQKREAEAQEQERIGEELRWQEVDEKQATHRPFTFQVSSGEKQIIFQKVNLSPVTLAKEAAPPSAVKESKTHKSSKGSHTLPSSLCVPHTAILVTGAQLCGTAVNLNQIKDTACKSLLGLTEERKTVDIPPLENTQKITPDPKPSSSKMKYAQETLNHQAILAEWASIRSRILKNAENGKLNEREQVSVSRHSDDWTPKGRGASHGNLRKTLSANAKFSITPAWQKFSETSKGSADAEIPSCIQVNEAEHTGKKTASSTEANQDVSHTEAPACKDNMPEIPREKTETHSEMADNTEGCMFAKDLPSFLVPSLPHSPSKGLSQSHSPAATETQQNVGTRKPDKLMPHGEENVSPFGIKFRRTNYSLRFHYDQQADQKKKKRYSAGDSFEGVPSPLVTTDNEKETIDASLKENTSPRLEKKDASGKTLKDPSNDVTENLHSAVPPVSPPANSQAPLLSQERPGCKSPLLTKPALAPKPTNRTPPSSPLSKMNRSNLAYSLGQRVAKAESDTSWKKESPLHPSAQNENKNEEEESREKKSFLPSITIPWRERDKPVLQSRHSLDGSKLMKKVESSQPLWITLALQKQKGFREQQATREERRQAREAKQAEKLAKENASVSHQSDNKSSNVSRTNAVQKSTAQEEEKKIETAVSKLERREQLKKSNTLPTSVTVEISDSIPSTPLAKEVTKRFSTPDANPVSTEPAWLALAKRKAKAWSDCPQIIK
uniref:Capping protein inhibiting regulator of actin dynamics n=1 Tax=Sphenodon punctatus TaxID=8508 RepID=A0A8D0LCY0_SPHPU